jgi:uncharacterized membrane protein
MGTESWETMTGVGMLEEDKEALRREALCRRRKKCFVMCQLLCVLAQVVRIVRGVVSSSTLLLATYHTL